MLLYGSSQSLLTRSSLPKVRAGYSPVGQSIPGDFIRNIHTLGACLLSQDDGFLPVLVNYVSTVLCWWELALKQLLLLQFLEVLIDVCVVRPMSIRL